MHSLNVISCAMVRWDSQPRTGQQHALNGKPRFSGYIVRDPNKTVSTSKSDFIWDEDEIDYMKQQRLLDKTFNRRRDEQTNYVECKALYEAMMGKPR